MSYWMRDDVTRAEMIERCRQDRDLLTERMMSLYPEFEGQVPAVWIENLISGVCGFRVDEYPLPEGQLGLCDMGNRLVLTNSEMGSFVDGDIPLRALRNVTLAHELGHVRLHADEMESQFVSRYNRWQKVRDSRQTQREIEADLYAAVFLVPTSMLVQHPEGAEIYAAWREGRALKPGWLRSLIEAVAADFGVTFALMRRSLEERGWLRPYGEAKKIALNLSSAAR